MPTPFSAGFRASAPNIEGARAAFKRIVGDGRRANAIIEEIRLMFRQDGMVLTVLDVNALIGEVLSLMRGDLENRHITIDTALSDRLAPVNANAVSLRQVMVNLITNAANAMSTVSNRQRLLRLGTQAMAPSSLLITVEDSGGGVDPKHADRIFEPFFTTKSHGMGMGLSICRSIVEHHGGSSRWHRAASTDRSFRSCCRSHRRSPPSRRRSRPELY
jgi:signal transduction histidine kinase